MAQNEMAELKT
jgi:hypothetical protein